MPAAEEPLNGDKPHHNSVLLLLFLGVIQSSLNTQKGSGAKTLLETLAIHGDPVHDRGLER